MRPYAPSVVDQLMDWIDHFPGPLWLFYLVALIVLIIISNGIAWIEGSVPVGTFDLYRSSIPFYSVASLALMHHLNHVARRALAAFRPALGAADTEYERFEYQLTTLPRRTTWSVLVLSPLLTAAFLFFTPYVATVFNVSPWLAAAEVVLYVIVFAVIMVLMYHTLRQLRLVSLIHTSATNVNLFQPTPLYAFSRLTAQTAIGLLLINYFSILTDPTTFVNPALNALTISTSLIAVACFVLPLNGMHDRIAAQKNRLRAEANIRLETTIQEIYRRADTQNLVEIDQLNKLMTSLVTAREEITKIPTWPWDPRTLTGFVSAFLLPFFFRFISILFAAAP
jgi:hypothetical protein